MTALEKALENLKSKVNYPKDYITILYGDAWEVQFFCHDKNIATGIHRTNLTLAIKEVINKVEEHHEQNRA